MGSGAHLSGLVRTAIGSLRIKDAMEIEQFENILSEMSTI
jgi:tRNA U55 pseudouridine synthase TruB